MLLGLAAAPGIILGHDDMATAPLWIWIGELGWLGIFIAYPAWAVWVGVVEKRLAQAAGHEEDSRPRVSLRPGA